MSAIHRRGSGRWLFGAAAAFFAWGCGAGPAEVLSGHPSGKVAEADGGTDAPDAGPPQVIDLRADGNRDGVVDVEDPSDDLPGWNAQYGAIFLANIDDDQKACPTRDARGRALSDSALAACHDAADEVINGPDDLIDLARLRVKRWPDAPDSARARLTLSPKAAAQVRLFKRDASGELTVLRPDTDLLIAEELRRGVELAIEAKDIVRDPSVWDGFADLTLTVETGGDGGVAIAGEDTVQLRVSPVVTFHHLVPAEAVLVTQVPGNPGSEAFRADLRQALSGKAVELYEPELGDQWIQDFLETGYMSMPAPGGQHVIRVNYRSANYYNRGDNNYPLREAGRIVFTHLRGKDVAGIQQFDRSTPREMQSLNSFGNFETVPPYSLGGVSYPLGRVLRGNISSFHPDPSFMKMIDAQQIQPAIDLDTSWLLVGHVDETLSFVKADTPRGWVVLAGDPALARAMLEAEAQKGNGAVKMFVGRSYVDWWTGQDYPAERSIADVLADTDIMSESAVAAAEIDAQLSILKSALGLAEEEIVRVPFLFEKTSGAALAYQPGTVNGLVLDDDHFLAPDPHGPVIDGKDIFKSQLEAALAPHGIQVHWVEDWDLYHRNAGEVHCGTNAVRAIPSAKWWESGR